MYLCRLRPSGTKEPIAYAAYAVRLSGFVRSHLCAVYISHGAGSQQFFGISRRRCWEEAFAFEVIASRGVPLVPPFVPVVEREEADCAFDVPA